LDAGGRLLGELLEEARQKARAGEGRFTGQDIRADECDPGAGPRSRQAGAGTAKSRSTVRWTGSEQRTGMAARLAWCQRETLPALMHEVQAFTRFGVPLTTVRTRWMFGFQRRDVRR
jgi:hypothetical protein